MSRRRNLHPTEGVRFVLERTEDQGTRATYLASVYTPDAVFSSTATLVDDGTAELPATGAPPELEERLATVARLIARDANKRKEDGLVTWPGRIMRWRK
ncbi:MAG: hypothetical protein SFX73_24130 [Kofleriaceae bacterium]|nr:hypothetical protein [Kofleriaceae bacterium]